MIIVSGNALDRLCRETEAAKSHSEYIFPDCSIRAYSNS